jgi:hypothetical protein
MFESFATPDAELTLTAGLFLGELILVYVGYAWISGIFEEDRQREAAHRSLGGEVVAAESTK